MLKGLLELLLAGVIFITVGFNHGLEDPKVAFANKMDKVSSGTLPELTLIMAKTFLGTPYVAHTLEGNPTEKLVCRFDALDCTTLVDVAVALAIARKQNLSYDQFLGIMTELRYTNGKIDGYASRQHYFLSWLYDAQKKGLVTDITKNLGGIPYNKQINFMSSHAALYEGISSPEILEKIKANESTLNAKKFYFIPKTSVRNIEPRLRDGDIIGITSSIEGLDCNHQGIVSIHNNRAFLLHASTSAHKVILSEQPLTDYLNSVKRHSGIIILRINENY